MEVHICGLGAPGVGNLPLSSISPTTSLGTAQVSPREPLPTIVGNATSMSIMTSDDALATTIVINSIVAGVLPDHSSSELIPSASSGVAAQESPAIFVRSVIDTPDLARSGDGITTSAPAGATLTEVAMVDSIPSQITIETVRMSTASETTTSDNERASTVPQEDMPFPADKTVPRDFSIDRRPPPSPRSDTDEESESPPRDIDSISIDSTESFPDITGRRPVTFDDERTKTAYEAWEIVLVKDKHARESWSSFCGIRFGTKWSIRNDGCVLTNAVVPFEQGELADMHEDAIRGCKHKRGTSQEKAYEQDLANRAYNLPEEIYDKIQQLLEDKTIATNRNPYRQREWRVVVLQPGEFQMTELLPERKRVNLFSRKRQPPITPTWFVILRGREVKSTKEDGGWKAYGRASNPWWRFDNRETKEARDQCKEMGKKMDQVHVHRRRQNRRRHGPNVPHYRWAQ
ncbi:hypothetical protein GQX73_g8578 [Xylaria multiplex]|uniref:Uncharacterized protein n=1 Tax=Xylaria multiplex TaxID=323545 RepID=A0A7C8IJ74_9PEZI|nr:hypothetical protein GQX73_g8578 [Xylaria multiplex]